MATQVTGAGGTTTSFSNTPQANNDVFNLTEDTVVLASGSQTIIVLDVMANDQGGNAKSLFSVDDGISASTATKQYAPIDLTTQDVQATGISAWESIGGGVSIRINNGKVEMDLSGYLAAHGFASLQAMGAGDQINETFTYAIKLGNGTLSWASVSVNIQGTNDGAIITAVPGADTTVVEAGGVANGTLNDPNAHGQLIITDPDVGQDHFQAPPSLQGTYGTFTFNTTTGVWAYTLNQTLADPLTQGQPVTDTLTVKSADGTASYNIVVNITGTNDAPVAIANVNSVKEDTAPNPVSGNVLSNDTDVDNGDTHSVSAVNGSAGNVGNDLVGTYGTLHLNSDGSYSYTLDNGLASVQQLAEGATVTDVFSYTNADNHGGSSSANLTITITGTNDAPVAVADINSVKEDTAPNPVSGNVLTNDTDVDTGDTHSVTAVNGVTGNVGTDVTGTYGTLHLNSNGTYTYTLNNSLASVQALAQGASVTDVFTYTNSDNHGGSSTANLTVTVNGTDDASATLISSVVDGKQGNNATPSTVTITFTSAVTANFANLSDVMHVTGLPNVSVIAGSGSFNAAHTQYTFQVDKGAGSNNGSSYTLNIDSGAFTDTTGHTNAAKTTSGLKPAGTSGEPINLALTDPSHEGALITVTVKDVPSGWTIDGATHNADGSWTVQTNDLHGLTVTTPADFTGAAVLDVQMSWINADGTLGTASIADNVEAYAPGSPIFAWSGDDVLTGSHGNDLFVFSQPIGADTVHNFDAAADQIDLIGYSGLADFADLQTHIADDANGNAVIALGDGQSITLDGVHSGALTASNFVFDQTPVVNNSGTMTIGDGALLPLSGIINNSGLISLGSTGSDTLLQVIQHGVTLQGGGQILLSDSAANMISGTGPDVTLVNVDNTISGAGQLGGGMLSLDNRGTIIASGSNALVIDTGGSVVTNSGTLEATGSGGLTITGGLANSGMLWANGGDIVIHGQVTGDGDATIGNLSKLEFGGASSTDVTFGHDAAGTLQLDDSFDYSGRIGGITNDDRLDLGDILFGAGTTAVYQANQDGSGGTLTVSDGTHGAALHLVGSYDANAFKLADDGQGHTVVSYSPAEFTLTGIGSGAISSDLVV
ncbi:VCBS domain-containing protein [Mesorhizobium sp. M8A.F.Ca.ET.021.01.1.1]|uniref:beta strand repeat-containing protein n=2 Tax=unclassified Mesorhizobium TaxID=325217 RepID=UPI000FC9D2E5|nr:VCBS domain-containing protein [Mesorhizobium sp. M8A.F.Ca.ET.021.01.1.1]RUW55426.1 adhesin [Mesorhizobium sp. M8A.F.Ca.ET.021.01.1.1]